MSNDITLRRGQPGFGGGDGGLHTLTNKQGDKRQWDADSKLADA